MPIIVIGRTRVIGNLTAVITVKFAATTPLSGQTALTTTAWQGVRVTPPGHGALIAAVHQKFIAVNDAFPLTFSFILAPGVAFPLTFPFYWGRTLFPGSGALTATAQPKQVTPLRGTGVLAAGAYNVQRQLSGAGRLTASAGLQYAAPVALKSSSRLTATTVQRCVAVNGIFPYTFPFLLDGYTFPITDPFPLTFPFLFAGTQINDPFPCTFPFALGGIQIPYTFPFPLGPGTYFGGVGRLTARLKVKITPAGPRSTSRLTATCQPKLRTPLRGNGALTAVAVANHFTLPALLVSTGSLTVTTVALFPEGHVPIPIDPDPNFGPSIFMSDYEFPPSGTVVVDPLPRSEGGLIQSVKSAVVEAMRDALQGVSLFVSGQAVYISLEYPLEQVQYPGIWVQFSTTKLNRSGIGQEITVQDPVTSIWSFIQEWTFMGRITLTIIALKSIDRDRLADALISNIAFARTPELLITMPQADTKQNRSLITALDENPFVAMTLNTDTIIPGGQSVSMGTPWKDDLLTYEDNYSLDLVGQFNLQFTHDGVYSLARIDPAFTVAAMQQAYNPTQWLDAVPVGPLSGLLTSPSGQMNPANTNIPAF